MPDLSASPNPIGGRSPIRAQPGCSADRGKKLLGSRVLIVEDEALVAIELQLAFEDAGAEVLGPAMSLTAALTMAEHAAQIDCALLDVDLAGRDVYPVARILRRRGIPFIFHTGHGSHLIHGEMFPGSTTCLKPTSSETLIELLAAL